MLVGLIVNCVLLCLGLAVVLMVFRFMVECLGFILWCLPCVCEYVEVFLFDSSIVVEFLVVYGIVVDLADY